MSTGTLFIVTAPSGAGKTSLIDALRKQDQQIRLSISHTTRQPRPGETHGVEYFFVDNAEFQKKIDAGEFLEHARVFDNYYGTTGQSIKDELAEGMDVILEIDWQGARQVRKHFSEAVSIFIIPPTKKALAMRLEDRGQDDEEVIKLRMQEAVSEISHYVEFDYLIVNDDFMQALEELQAVFIANRVRLARQSQVCQSLLEDLLATAKD